MPKSKSSKQQQGLKAIVGIAADGTEDWTEEFLFASPRTAETDGLSLKKPAEPRDVKVALLDDDEPWDDDDDGKLTPPRKLSLKLAEPPSVDKYRETEESFDFDVDLEGDSSTKLAQLAQIPSHEGLTDAEDWDNEFGINEVVEQNQHSMAQGFKHLIKEVADFGHIGDDTSLRISVERKDFKAYSIPSKCRIVSQLVEGRQQGHMIIRYPKGCEMDMLLFDGNRKVLSGQQLEEWLEHMVTQHEQMLQFMDKERTVQWLLTKRNRQSRLTLNELIATREVIETLYRRKAIPECLEQLRAFAQRLKSFARWLRPSKRGSSGDPKEASKPARRFSQETDRAQFFRNLMSVLHIAGIVDMDLKEVPVDLQLSKATAEFRNSTKTGGRTKRLCTELLRAAAECLPEYKDSFAVLELRIAAHNLANSTENRTLDLKLQDSRRGNARHSSVAFAICSSYLKLYYRIIDGLHMLGKHPGEMDAPSLQIVISILADLYFYMNGISPLTLQFSQQLQQCVNELGELPGSDEDDEDEEGSFATEEEYPSDEGYSESEVSSEGDAHKHDDDTEDWDDDFDDLPGESSVLSTPGHRLPSSSVSFSTTEDAPTASPSISVGTVKQHGTGAQRRKSRARTLFRLEERINIGGDDDPRELLQLIQNDTALYKEMLLQDYRRYPDLTWAKHRGAIALGGLCRQAADDGSAEMFYVEALYVMSKLSTAQTDIPLLTDEGCYTLEKVGDILVRNGKYKFGIVALEGAIQCHQLQHTREERRLYRKLSLTTQEHKDIARSLKYNSYMLRIAYDARNFNEFVFVADALSRLLMELGAFIQAENCMKIASQLLDGLSPSLISFRKIEDDTLIPVNIELPVISQAVMQNTDQSRRRRLHEVPSTPSSLQNMVAASNGLLDSQQLQLQFKMADTLMTAYKHGQAVDVLKRLLRRRIPSQSRAQVLMKLARCYLKLRLIGACEASLNRLTQEAEEVIVSLSDRGGESTSQSATTAAVGLVSIVRSVEYLVCRCRARLAIDDPATALHWLSIAFSVCPKGKFGQLGQLHYLQGRAYEALCLSLHDHDTGEILDVDEEARMAKLAEDNFRQAYSHYRKTDDYVHQVKSLTRIAQLQATRLFPLIALRGIPASEALNGTGSMVLDDVEEVAALALELAGDLASPLPLAFALITFAEISFLKDRSNLAQSAWAETQGLLRLTFLQQSADDGDDLSGMPQQSALGDPFSATSNPSGFFDQTKNVSHTPLFGMPLPTVQHPPGLMLRLHSILKRLVRLAFVLRPSRLGTHSELIGSWMRFDLHANMLRRSFEVLRPIRRRQSKFDLSDSIAHNLAAEGDAGSSARAHSPRMTPRLHHPSYTRPTIPADRRRTSKRFARFVRIAELDHIITIRADPPPASAAAGTGILRAVPSRATTVSDKSDRTGGMGSIADAMDIIKNAFSLDVGMSALPKAIAAVEQAVLDLQRTPCVDIHTVMNADGTIVDRDAGPLAAQPQARIRGRSMAAAMDHPREPATPIVGEHVAHQSSLHESQGPSAGEDSHRELYCAAYFLQLRMYTRKYVSGKMALSNYAQQNMETLHHLVKFSPYLRQPRSEGWIGSGSEESKQNSPVPPAEEPSPLRPSVIEAGHASERRLLQQSSRQDSFRSQMRRRSTQDEPPASKPGHKSRSSDGQAVAAAAATHRNSSGNGSPRQAATLNTSSPQLTKLRLYPLSFRFCIYMDGCFLFHCPDTGARKIVPLERQSQTDRHGRASETEQDEVKDSQPTNLRVDTTVDEQKDGQRDERGVALESSILNALRKLPLIPGEEPVLSAMDDALTVIVERLGYKYVLFLVNALLLDQPVLLLASPGHEEALVFCATALLRLLRPLQWQHMYIPLMHSSMRTALRSVVNAKTPFLVGAYHDILDSLMAPSQANSNAPDRDVIAFGDARARTTVFKTISYQALGHVTIVDLDAGIIIPGAPLKYAAATTMSATPVPDIDRSIVDFILEQQNVARGKDHGHSFVPPLPPRYRLALHQRMDVASSALLPADLQDRDRAKRRVSHNSVTSTQSVGFFGAQCVAEAFRGGLFTVMISLFKGLRLFVYDPTTVPAQKEVRRRVVSERRTSEPGQGSLLARWLNRNRNTLPTPSRTAEERVPASRPIPESETPFFVTETLMFDCHGFIQFLKDDVRPFMRCLVHTPGFRALVGAMVAWFAQPQPNEDMPDSYMKMFCTAAHQRMEQKLRIHSQVAEKRVVGYLLTYFVRAVREEQEQPFSFVHQFPYMPTESTKVKRRWCVLDAQRLTYFRSHSKGRIKDHILINSDNVRLVNSPFSGHEGTQTNESDYFALVIGESRVIVLRAELRQSHDKWLQALRARLLRDDAKARMDMLYAGLKATL